MKFSTRTLLVIVFLAAVVCSVLATWYRHHQQIRTIEAPYEVAFLVCDHLDANKGKWPPNWKSLKPFHDARFPDETFEKLQDYVVLDFTIDGDVLLETCVNSQLYSKFKPIRSIGVDDEDYDDGPNLHILRHVGRIISY